MLVTRIQTFRLQLCYIQEKTVDRDSLGSVSVKDSENFTLSSKSLYHENLYLENSCQSQSLFYHQEENSEHTQQFSCNEELSAFMFYWILETQKILYISSLWRTFSLPSFVGKTFAWDSGICKVSKICDYLTVSMCQYVAVYQKRKKYCQLIIKPLIIDFENQFVSRNEGFKINIVYSL